MPTAAENKTDLRDVVLVKVKSSKKGLYELSSEIGISYQTLANYIKGRSLPRRWTLEALKKWVEDGDKTPLPAVPAWELVGEDLRCAIDTEWREWACFENIDALIPGGAQAISSYLLGADPDPEMLLALRLHMGFATPAEETAWLSQEYQHTKGEISQAGAATTSSAESAVSVAVSDKIALPQIPQQIESWRRGRSKVRRRSKQCRSRKR